MKSHFDDELKKLKEKVYKMGLMVEEAVKKSTDAIFNRDSALGEQVIRQDQEINLYEIELDEMCHELIALHQPIAADLRLLTMVLKMTNDLERMGDQAVNIAEAAFIINKEAFPKFYEDLPRMAGLVSRMVHDALESFIEDDAEKAKAICERDDEVDGANDKIYQDVQTGLKAAPEQAGLGISLIMVSHNLERIADLATNIAEDVIYLKRGIDIRHHIRERREEGTV